MSVLKAKARVTEATVRIGKLGLTEGIIEEIKNQVKKRKLVKIRISPAILKEKDRKQFAGELAGKTGSRVVQQVGFVVVLASK